MLRVGQIGLGRWGRRLLAALDRRGAVVVACNRSDPDARAWLAQNHPSVQHTFDPDAVLRHPGVGAVIVATPIATHDALARAALEAGKHVFVEKPLATDADEAASLAHLAESRGLTLFVGQTYAYHPLLLRVRELLDGDPVKVAHLTWRKLGTFDEDLFWNLMVHEVSVLDGLFEREPRHVEVVAESGVMTTCDFACVKLSYERGGTAIVSVDRCSPLREKSVVVKTESGRVLAWTSDRLEELGGDGTKTLLHTRSEDMLDIEIDHFLDCVERGRPPITDGRYGARMVEQVARIIDARGVPS